MKVAIIKYNAGNVQSVIYALNRIGIEPILTDNPAEIKSSGRVIFPGVGEASSAMKYLRENKIDRLITELTQPFLGICLGMQLMCSFSEENNTDCLGIFNAEVRKFPKIKKVPHIGWNTVTDFKSGIFKGVTDKSYLYFVHSYYVKMSENSIASTNYILNFSSAFQRDNFYGVQFHPEKSGQIGEQILKNFININI